MIYNSIMSLCPKEISLYIANLAYKCGGTESYAANLIEALQNIYPESSIFIITEYWKKTVKLDSSMMAATLNEIYGTKIIEKNISVDYIKSSVQRGRFENFLFQRKLHAKTRKKDLFFNCSRGLLTGKAKKNIAIIHFPPDKKVTFPFYKKFPFFKIFAKLTDKHFFERYDFFLPNSNFTSYWLKEIWAIPEEKIKVIYPPVNFVNVQAQKKLGSIFVCSRIEPSKKIEEIIRAFLSSEKLKERCVLIIAGSIKGESVSYRNHLESISPLVRFVFEPTWKEIEELYAESTFFWHAKGFQETNPYLMEHFGITPIEAMSAGCIPVVINKGGLAEIVTSDCGFRWNTLEELVQFTEFVLAEPEKVESFSKASIEKSKEFSVQVYTESLAKLLKQL